MDPMESDCTAIVKQEVIIDDLKTHDYEHLLREFYYNEPDPDEHHNEASDEIQIKDEVPDPEESPSDGILTLDVQPGPDGYWNCPVCVNSFRWRITFEIHIKNHFRCAACELSFLTRAAFDHHNQNKHGLIALPVIEYDQVPLDQLRNVSSAPVRCAPLLIPADSESFNEETAQTGFLEDDFMSSVIVKEEFVFEGQDDVDDDETSLVDVLHSRTDIRAVEAPRISGAQRTILPTKRPESAQRCPVCKVWYHTVSGLEKHLQRHHGRQLCLNCARCGETFASHHRYKLHQNRHSNIDSGRFKCSHCSKPLATKRELIVHEGRNHPTIPLKISLKRENNLCEQAKPWVIAPEDNAKHKQPTFALHGRYGRPKGSRRCPLCKQWFLTQDELRGHISIHGGKASIVIASNNALEMLLELKSKPMAKERRKVGRPKGSRKCVSDVVVKSEEKERPNRLDVRQTGDHSTSARGKILELKSEPMVHERRKVGRPKGSLKSVSEVVVKSEEKERPNRLDVRQTGDHSTSARGKLLELKLEPMAKERRKVGRPKGSRKSVSEVVVKSEEKERPNRLDVRQTGDHSTSARGKLHELKSEPMAKERRKVGRPKGSRKCVSEFVVKSEEKGRPNRLDVRQTGDRSTPARGKLLELKLEPMAKERRKVGRPKGSRKCVSSLEMKSEQTPHERAYLSEVTLERVSLKRRKVGRPKGSRNKKLNEIKQMPSSAQRRKVGRPRKYGNHSKVRGRPKGSKNRPKVIQVEKLCGKKSMSLRQVRRKVGRPKGSKIRQNVKQPDGDQKSGVSRSKAKSIAYCARCNKNFLAYASFKIHKIRHQNLDLGRFECKPCAKSFASKKEQIIHEKIGHKLKTGRPSMVASTLELPAQKESPATDQVDETPFRRNAGRRRELPQTAGFGRNERIRKVGRPQGTRKCPLCKVWFRSAAMFNDHIGSHISE